LACSGAVVTAAQVCHSAGIDELDRLGHGCGR
jgi:hypothetical protein